MDTPLPDGKGVLVETYGNAEFSRDVIQKFSSLQDALEQDAGLLHPQMFTLAVALRRALELGDTGLPMQICGFLDEVLRKRNAISEIENAIAISFVEAHELKVSALGRTVLEKMPEAVRRVLLEQERRGGAQ
jgi:hypothetical protein